MMELAVDNNQLNSYIESVTLTQIDVDNQKSTPIPIGGDKKDLKSYLDELLSEIKTQKHKREYNFQRNTTEFYKTLEAIADPTNTTKDESANSLAARLLSKEIDADKKYGHLGNSTKTKPKKDNTHLKKGSFLQFIYYENNIQSYLGVKIEHQLFLDEDDFRKKIGLSVSNKIYKACKVDFDLSHNPINVLVFDTNTKPAVYWWNDFLELKEERTDAYNTEIACNEVIKVINGIKKDFPADYTYLRNAVITAFKQKEQQMDYSDFIEKTISHYVPVDAKLLEEKLPKIIKKLQELPDKKNFDVRFNLIPSSVPFKKGTIKLSKEITLHIDEDIENIEKKIWSEQRPCGMKVVVINSTEGYDCFKPKS